MEWKSKKLEEKIQKKRQNELVTILQSKIDINFIAAKLMKDIQNITYIWNQIAGKRSEYITSISKFESVLTRLWR